MIKYTVEAFSPSAYTCAVYDLESLEIAREEVKNQIVNNRMSGAIIWSEGDSGSGWTHKKVESYSFKDFE